MPLGHGAIRAGLAASCISGSPRRSRPVWWSRRSSPSRLALRLRLRRPAARGRSGEVYPGLGAACNSGLPLENLYHKPQRTRNRNAPALTPPLRQPVAVTGGDRSPGGTAYWAPPPHLPTPEFAAIPRSRRTTMGYRRIGERSHLQLNADISRCDFSVRQPEGWKVRFP
jgi:hypothetical protein